MMSSALDRPAFGLPRAGVFLARAHLAGVLRAPAAFFGRAGRNGRARHRPAAAVSSLVGAAAGLLIGSAALAQVPCMGAPDLLEHLDRVYGEGVLATGTATGEVRLAITVNPETGSWTIIVIHPDGMTATRADDERVLAVLRLRCRGLSAGQIARRLQMASRSAVLGVVKRVMDDDLRLSGEPATVVLACYAIGEERA